MRRNQFQVNAESVQGIPGATVTFKRITVGERERYIKDSEYDDAQMVGEHIVDWQGIVDDDGNDIPSPKDEPGVIAVLYIDELAALVRLLIQGPDGENAKN